MKWIKWAIGTLLGSALLLGAIVAARPAGVSGGVPGGQVDANAARTDQGGNVTFEVTPLNLGSSADTVEFEVVMDTHSVDL
ncbi:MAG TPA: hypothetical protein VLC52_16030, partial [Anaerolineae bacterium]|nr:hypothetical protein [Anaerolineae bacterium]